MTRSADELLATHVDAFNEGVRSGEFSRMVEGLTPDAEMSFEGVPVGPFRGRDAIAKAYRDQPPDDELTVLDWAEDDDGNLVARYAWNREPGVPAGRLILTPAGDRIGRLVITFDAPGAA